MTNLIGKVLGKRYIIIEKIGEGGMALVYKARCQLLNRYVAVKILKPEFTSDEEFVKKFKRESLSAASLSHPNIVSVYDVGEEDGIYYIVMEYVQGQTLKEYIKRNGKIGFRETLKIINQIALALEHAHKNGVVHRDIKPHNILITEDKIVKVADFGIARASTNTTITNTDKILGSVHYLSPEQARGSYTDHRTDIYSLGVVMYEMLTGRLPYDADSPISIAIKHIEENLITPLEIDDSIPKAVNDIVLKAMEKNVAKRYQNAKEMLDDIAKAQENPNIPLFYNENEEDATKIIGINEINSALNENNRKKKKGKLIYVIMTTLILILTAAFLVYAYNKYFIVKDVKVPSIIGLSEEEAKKVLESRKLFMEVANRVSDKKPAGQVIRVYPDENTTVKQNSTVRVVISTGPNQVKVPDLANMDLITAESLIKKNGLKIGIIERKNSDTVQKDLIISQSPEKGTMVQEGTEINIVISDGPELKLVTVPSLLGKSLDNAINELKKANLNLGTISYSEDNNYPDGVVIDQDVAQNIQVKEGTIINITVNKLNTANNDNQNTQQTETGQ
ncbi:Stk1 family PASTA domain-containing Ser/Thr kinase [Caloramator sp. E03]|uniref:Stk1 family PASTA domain-containing Ser/Thr kinase n=1 Tax=Caloramator sp. E03 TaxID=2576307 RepID=UPI001110734F|nr:Stk1 family PASTA domain-containing Ser/Thr kinase [Caloramator sp. E03]QCX32222.1 Stk1 family PASTA domain-containing Ser/Thr kinase [Caloramator sp. E03]